MGTLGFTIFPNVPTKSSTPDLPTTIKERLPGHILPRMATRSHSILPGKFDQPSAAAAYARAFAARRTPRTEQNPTVHQARQSSLWSEWIKAIDKEIATLTEMDTYIPVRKHEVPKHCQIIQSKMDLKMKLDTLGQLIKLKARLVALGNLEWASIRDTYAPTVNAKTINLILALAAQERMILYGLDITGAFLTADISGSVHSIT
jgi:hypothetical protein